MIDEDAGGEHVRPRHVIAHYYGDTVRALFIICAILLVVAKSTGAQMPLSTVETLIGAVFLVIAAGVTNPNQRGIHWLNGALAILGTLIFGVSSVHNYSAGEKILQGGFIYTEALAILFLIALYFVTRTVRGTLQRRSGERF